MEHWTTNAKRYLARLGFAEYQQQLRAHLKRGRRVSTFRYAPTDYHGQLIAFLDSNDERGFKDLKGLQGYANVLKH